MFDLVGFLTSLRVFLGAFIGLLVGLGLAYMLRIQVGTHVAIELLALVVAIFICFGIGLAARTRSSE